RVVSVARGHDPRDFTLVAFGGAGPLHACELAASLRIPRVLVPLYPGVLSAFGMARAPVVKDLSAVVVAQGPDQASLEKTAHALIDNGRSELDAEGISLKGIAAQTILQMRYAGQSYELPIPVESLDPAHFLPLFHEAHHARYGHSDPARPVEVVTLRVKLTLPAAEHSAGRPTPERKGGRLPPTERDVWFP